MSDTKNPCVTLGLAPSFGFGDRIGLATPGHVEAMNRSGSGIEPIFQPCIRSKHGETFSHTLFSSLDVLRRNVDLVQLHALGPSLYHHGRGEGRFIVYNVGCLQSAGKFDAIAIGEDVEDATSALEVELVERLGISVS